MYFLNFGFENAYMKLDMMFYRRSDCMGVFFNFVSIDFAMMIVL